MATKLKKNARNNTSIYVIGRHYDEMMNRAFTRGLISIVKAEDTSVRLRSPRSDAKAISSDWGRVGDSICHAIITYQCN